MEKTKLPNLVTILILTLITAVVWISLSVYRAVTTKAPAAVPSNISQPLTPTLNQTVIKNIESGGFYSGSQVPENVTTLTPSIQPTPAVIPTPTIEATPTASPSASPTP